MTAVDIRVQEAGTIKVNEVLTQVVPELMYEAAKAIQNHDLVVEKYPEHAFVLNKMLDLRLRIIKETYLCDQINARVERIKREVAAKLVVWAKDKSFGPMLGKDGLIDMKKAKKLALSIGKDRVIKAVNDYNNQLVPYANELKGTKGDWSREESARATALQNLQREHNALAIQMRALIK